MIVGDDCDRRTGTWGMARSVHSPFFSRPEQVADLLAGTSVRCYVGEPRPSGKDTVVLSPATAIVVSYP